MNLDILLLEYNKLLEEINQLKEKSDVCRFNELIEKRDELYAKIKSMYITKKVHDYSECNHLWLETPNDLHNPNYVLSIGCMKCGVDTGLLKKRKKLEDMTLEELAIYEYLKKGTNRSYNFVDTVCDLNLARAIYSKILENNPDIDNRTLAGYFLNALNDIRNIEVSEERQVGRAKRLGLESNFNNWKKLSKNI